LPRKRDIEAAIAAYNAACRHASATQRQSCLLAIRPNSVCSATGNNGSNTTRFFDIVTDAGAGSTISQTVNLPATTSAHSITVDPFNGDVFVALAGTTLDPCPVTQKHPGCIDLFALSTVLETPEACRFCRSDWSA
jgi:hypothetical protein